MRDRVKEFRRVAARELHKNKKNWRRHPDRQRAALRAIITEGELASAVVAYRTFDEHFIGRDDFDWTLRTLIEDLILFVDNRFYFDHGPIFAGQGGNVGLVDENGFDNSSRLLKKFYGSAVEFTDSRFSKRRKRQRDGRTAMCLRVERRQTNVYF